MHQFGPDNNDDHLPDHGFRSAVGFPYLRFRPAAEGAVRYIINSITVDSPVQESRNLACGLVYTDEALSAISPKIFHDNVREYMSANLLVKHFEQEINKAEDKFSTPNFDTDEAQDPVDLILSQHLAHIEARILAGGILACGRQIFFVSFVDRNSHEMLLPGVSDEGLADFNHPCLRSKDQLTGVILEISLPDIDGVCRIDSDSHFINQALWQVQIESLLCGQISPWLGARLKADCQDLGLYNCLFTVLSTQIVQDDSGLAALIGVNQEDSPADVPATHRPGSSKQKTITQHNIGFLKIELTSQQVGDDTVFFLDDSVFFPEDSDYMESLILASSSGQNEPVRLNKKSTPAAERIPTTSFNKPRQFSDIDLSDSTYSLEIGLQVLMEDMKYSKCIRLNSAAAIPDFYRSLFNLASQMRSRLQGSNPEASPASEEILIFTANRPNQNDPSHIMLIDLYPEHKSEENESFLPKLILGFKRLPGQRFSVKFLGLQLEQQQLKQSLLDLNFCGYDSPLGLLLYSFAKNKSIADSRKDLKQQGSQHSIYLGYSSNQPDSESVHRFHILICNPESQEKELCSICWDEDSGLLPMTDFAGIDGMIGEVVFDSE